MSIVSHFTQAKTFLRSNQRYVAPAALVVGFVLDSLTLNRIDQVFDQSVLVVHILIVATAILLLFRWYRLGETSGISDKRAQLLYTLLSFSIGGVYSGLVIFYGRSGSLINSWPLLIILVIFLFGSEFAKKYFRVINVQLIALSVALYGYLIILVPLLAHDIGAIWFLASSTLWLGCMAGYGLLVARVGRVRYRSLIKRHAWIIAAVLVSFQVVYWGRILPPVPLSLKFDSVYHSVTRTEEGYIAEYEPNPFWQFWDKRDNTLSHVSGDSVYLFTSIFAPDKFSTRIYHEWQYKKDGTWTTTDRIGMTIVGGADRGYRGYSYKRNLPSDHWRIRSVTEDGRVIGVTMLRLEEREPEPELIAEIL